MRRLSSTFERASRSPLARGSASPRLRLGSPTFERASRSPIAYAAAAVAAVALAFGGCGGTAVPPPSGPYDVMLGTSALDGSGWYPLTGDQPLVPGAQGGFHVWVKWRVEGMAPQKVHVEREVHRTADAALILKTTQAVDTGNPDGQGGWTLPAAQPSFMCPTPVGISVEDQQVKFDLVLRADQNGEPAEELGRSSATATPRCPTDGQQQFCQQICNG
jgi:hypothetical protein